MWTDGGLGLEEYTESVIRTKKKTPVGPRSSDGGALYTVAATESLIIWFWEARRRMLLYHPVEQREVMVPKSAAM